MTPSATATDGPGTREPGPLDPWERWGWAYACVWLFFLAFPLVDAFRLDGPTWQRALTVGAVVAFAAVYVSAWVLAVKHQHTAERRTPVVLAALLGLWGVVVSQIGATALGMLIFVVVCALLLGSRRTAVVGLAVVLVLAVATTLVVGFAEGGFLLGMILLMTVVSVLLRTMEERRATWQQLQEQVAVTVERERVARDVHDVLGHSLTVITTKAELAQRLVDLDTPESRRRASAELTSIQSLGREALTEVRATVAGLRVARLGDELAGAREALAAAGIAAEVPDDPDAVDPRRRLVVAWVLREAVTNVVRHSDASRCEVRLGTHSLVVTDDGRGLDTAEGSSSGNGLRGARERVTAAGGTLTLADARPGTRLEVAWP